MTDLETSSPPEISPSARIASILLNILILLALLYVFLFSIALFGAAFKLVGKEFSQQLIATTTNPVVGLMIGLLKKIQKRSQAHDSKIADAFEKDGPFSL